MNMALRIAVFLLVWVITLHLPFGSFAQTKHGLGRVDASQSGIRDTDNGLELDLFLSRDMPWRVFTMEAPRRLVIDVSEVIWPENIPLASDIAFSVGMGSFAPNWSRMVVELGAPMVVEEASLEPAGALSRLSVRLKPATPTEFAVASGAPIGALVDERRRVAAEHAAGEEPLHRVMIDPAHGPTSPGDTFGGVTEAALSFEVALELRDALRETGRFQVALSRPVDASPSTDQRLRRAEGLGADLIISIHADAPSSGSRGIQVGSPMSGTLGTRLTFYEAEALVKILVQAGKERGVTMNSAPERFGPPLATTASWIPSIQFDLGYLNAARNRDLNVPSADRQLFTDAIVLGLLRWSQVRVQAQADTRN